MRTNVKERKPKIFTHEGAKAARTTFEQQLRRSVMACMLWEDSFYESGEEIAKRISSLIQRVPAETVAQIAVEARTKQKLRHVPLLIAREMARLDTHKYIVGELLPEIIQRPDELTEFMSIYWKDGKCPVSAQVKKGLATAFHNFSEYQFAKYNGDGPVKLKDVLFLCHAKPSEIENRANVYTRKYKNDTEKNLLRHEGTLFGKIVAGNLTTPDTWEVALSSGADKGETWTRLLNEEKLGALAFIRNLRNMQQANVNHGLVRSYAAHVQLDRVLPFRFIAAARAVPQWEDIIESMMLRCAELQEKLPGKTCVVIDNSGSMYNCKVSAKSDLDRSDAACALAILIREICKEVLIISYSDTPAIVAPRRGFALAEAIKNGIRIGATDTAQAIRFAAGYGYDRIIVITDEQSHTTISGPIRGSKSYFVNVSVCKNGIGYGVWTHIDGWSEAILDYIRAYEED